MRNSLSLFRNNFWLDDVEPRWNFAPKCDIEETASAYKLTFDLPGLKKEDVKIELVDRQIVVSGERKSEREEEGKLRHLSERVYGAFQRVFTLPAVVEADRVEAKFEHGVLEIVVPKVEEARPKLVRIS